MALAVSGRHAVSRTDALVVYESALGRTQSLAQAVAEVLGDASAWPVACLPLRAATRHAVERTGLLVVGAPTRTTGRGDRRVDLYRTGLVSDALRGWLTALPPGYGRSAAVFDTRPRAGTPGAADVVAAALQGSDYALVSPPASFVVDGPVGPLPPEEWRRARAWAAHLPVAQVVG